MTEATWGGEPETAPRAARRRAQRVPGEPVEVQERGAEAVDESLPDADSIDPRKITRPTLTKTGWVVPK